MPPSKPKVPAGEKDKNKKKKVGRKKVEDHVEHEEEVERKKSKPGKLWTHLED